MTTLILMVIGVILYGIYRNQKKAEQRVEREKEIKLKSFVKRYGEAPDDPDALKAYYDAMDREGVE